MGFIAQTRKLYRRRVSGNLLAVGTGLQFPVHTFGKLEGALEEAEARVQFLDYQIEDSRQRVALEVRTAYYRLEHAFESIPLHRVQTEAAGGGAEAGAGSLPGTARHDGRIERSCGTTSRR